MLHAAIALVFAGTIDVADMRAVCDALEDETAREDCHMGIDLAKRQDQTEPPKLDWGDGDSDVERAERKLAMRDMARRIFGRADKRARDAVAKTSLGKAATAAHAERFYECIGADPALLPRPLPIPRATGYSDLTEVELAALKPFADKWGYPWPPEEGRALTEAECDNLRRRGKMSRHEICFKKNEWKWGNSKVCRNHAHAAAEERIASLVEELRQEFIEEYLQALTESMSEPAIEEVRSEIKSWSI